MKAVDELKTNSALRAFFFFNESLIIRNKSSHKLKRLPPPLLFSPPCGYISLRQRLESFVITDVGCGQLRTQHRGAAGVELV